MADLYPTSPSSWDIQSTKTYFCRYEKKEITADELGALLEKDETTRYNLIEQGRTASRIHQEAKRNILAFDYTQMSHGPFRFGFGPNHFEDYAKVDRAGKCLRYNLEYARCVAVEHLALLTKRGIAKGHPAFDITANHIETWKRVGGDLEEARKEYDRVTRDVKAAVGKAQREYDKTYLL